MPKMLNGCQLPMTRCIVRSFSDDGHRVHAYCGAETHDRVAAGWCYDPRECDCVPCLRARAARVASITAREPSE